MVSKVSSVSEVINTAKKVGKELQTPHIKDKEPKVPFKWIELEARKAQLCAIKKQIQSLEKPKAQLSGKMQIPTAEERIRLAALKAIEKEQEDYLTSQGVNLELFRGLDLFA